VDDNADAADSLAMVLRAWGHDVRTAHDGPSALDAAGWFRADGVLLDIGMPGMTGHDVARRLRERPELASYLLVIAALTALGNLDVWRYLVFALPVALILFAQYSERLHPREGLIAAAVTFVTVITQRPFQRMDADLYFQDWFPLYAIISDTPPAWQFLALWGVRLTTLSLLLAALLLIRPLRPRLHEQASSS